MQFTRPDLLPRRADRCSQLALLAILAILATALAPAALPLSAATPAGTVLLNQATLQSDVGSLASNASRVTVAQVAGVSVGPTSSAATTAPGAAACFPISITNSGNGADSFTLAPSSQRGWLVALCRDDNGDGIRQSTETTGVTSTGSLTAGSVFRLFAVVTVPAETTASIQDTVSVTATSVFSTTCTASGSYTVTATQTAAVGVDPASALMSAQPGQTVYVPVTASNLGNAPDTLALRVTCSEAWGIRVVADANQDGVHQDGELTTIVSTGALPAGGQLRAFVEVAVPSTAASQSTAAATLTVTSGVDGTRMAQGSYTVVAQGQVDGDVDGDGQVTSADASAAAQIAVGQGTWSASQIVAADANHDGAVDVRDVMLLLNAGGAQLSAQSTQTQTIRALSLPDVSAAAGSAVTIAVTIDDGAQLAAFQSEIGFDAGILNVTRVLPGSLMDGDQNWQIVANADAGRLRILAFNLAGVSLAAGTGSVLEVDVDVSPWALPEQASPLTWVSALATDASGTASASLQCADGSLRVDSAAVAASSLAVLVTNPQGTAPIAGATVQAWSDGQCAGEGVSDDMGDCVLPSLIPGEYEVRVSRAGYYTSVIPAVPVAAGECVSVAVGLVALTKANTGALEGYVFSTAGKPLKKAKVQLYLGTKRIATVYTDSSGRYYRTGLAVGSYRLAVSATGYAPSGAVVDVLANVLTMQDVALAPAVRTPKPSRRR